MATYLVSIYFDENTNQRIQEYVNQVAKRTGNHHMLEGKIPPHITISVFETNQLSAVIAHLEKCLQTQQRGQLEWVSVGTFLPYVIYLAPVLNQYLHQLSVSVYQTISAMEGVAIRACYQPFRWMPHTTIGKHLSREKMQEAFKVLQHSFGRLEGTVVRVGISKTNPYEEIVGWSL